MSAEPQEIMLNTRNSLEIVVQFLEIAQQKGAFSLIEADLLNRARVVLLAGASDPELTVVAAKQLFLQGVLKGQRHGAFTLGDAALLHTIVQYVSATLEEPVSAAVVSDEPQPAMPVIEEESEADVDVVAEKEVEAETDVEVDA